MNSLFKIITDSVANTDFLTSRQSILIEGLELMMSIGIHDFEKNKPQRVMVDIELQIDPKSKPQSDNINEVISYADIIEKITALSQEKHFALVETFANDVGIACLSMGSQAQKVTLTVKKPDIIQNANVGVTLSLEK